MLNFINLQNILLLNKGLFFVLLFIIRTISASYAQEIVFTEEEKQWIKAHPVVMFGYEPNWEPYEVYRNGKYEGIVGEYVSLLSEATGIKFKPIPGVTWSETIKGLKEGEIIMAPSCAVTPEREQFLNFTDSYIKDPLVIVTRIDSEPVTQLSDLVNKKIALPKSYYTSELIKIDYPSIEIIEQKGIQEALESLTYRSVDAFVGNLGVINYYMYNKGFTNIKVVAPTYFSGGGEIGLATTKSEPILRDIAQKVFDAISAKQSYEIRGRWLSSDINYGVPWSTFVKWIIVGFVLMIVVIVFFYYWNKTLRKYIDSKRKSEQQLKESLVEIKKQDNEKKVLLQEIHHRVKNNLQVVSSMIRLQASYNKDPEASKTLHEADERVKTIALIHEKIYQSPNLDRVCLEEYTNSLINEVLQNFSGPNKLSVAINASQVCIPIDYIVPFALILNELVTNSVKYAFSDTAYPKIELEIEHKDSWLSMRYFDNGKWQENPDSDNFGTSLIDVFTEQLDGEYQLNKSNSGTEYLFKLKIDQ